MLIGTERLKPCPSCNNENVYLQPFHDGWVHCNDCATTAPHDVWQGPRKRIEELEARNKHLEETLEKLRPLLMEHLMDYDCPVGSMGVFVSEEAVTAHCQCAGTGWDEETCPDSKECWELLIARNEVSDMSPKR